MQTRNIQNAPGTVKKALDILEALAEVGGALGVTELGHRVQTHKSTVYRILQVLLQRGYVDQDTGNNKYSLGTKILSMGGAILSRLPLHAVGKPILEALSAETSQTVRLATLDRDEVVYIEHVEGQDPIQLRLQIGSRGPVYCTAAGKAILAFLPESEREEIVTRCRFQARTPKTIVSAAILRSHLDLVGKQGYSFCDEEYTDGVRAIGAPIFDLHGNTAGAVVIVAPSFRMRIKEIPAFGQKVRDAAGEISRKMGFSPPESGTQMGGNRK
jgi:IclR family transcriptional regulator, KDG regulon repressor